MRKAFTIIELIFVMVILGILASVATRGCSSYNNEYRADQAPVQYSEEYLRHQRGE
jgi:prepilin-type N-terminal cleavage/methylation domain-containing protein